MIQVRLHTPAGWARLALGLCLMALAQCSNVAVAAAPNAAREEVHEYTGTMEPGLKIGMGLAFSPDGRTVRGTYFYNRFGQDIRVEGELTNRQVTLREHDAQGRVTARFTGEFPPQDPKGRYGGSRLNREVLIGRWERTDGSGARPFELALGHIWWRVGAQSRYANAGFDDAGAVDDFARKFQAAVVKRDAVTVAAMVQYPIEVSLRGKRVRLADAAALQREFTAVFDHEFTRRIEACATAHLFSRSEGVMLGNGEIWLAPAREQAAKSGTRAVPRVVSLNRP